MPWFPRGPDKPTSWSKRKVIQQRHLFSTYRHFVLLDGFIDLHEGDGNACSTWKKMHDMGVKSTITPRLPGRWAAWRTSSRASTSHMACSRSCPRCPYKTFQLLWHRDRRTKKKCVCMCVSVSVEITTTRTNHFMLNERVLSQEVEQISVISCWTATVYIANLHAWFMRWLGAISSFSTRLVRLISAVVTFDFTLDSIINTFLTIKPGYGDGFEEDEIEKAHPAGGVVIKQLEHVETTLGDFNAHTGTHICFRG